MGKAAETLILHGIMSNAAAYKKQAEEVGAQVKSALLRHGDERAPKTRKLTVDEALAKGSALLTKTALPSNRNDSTPPPPSSSSSNVASPQPQPAPRMTPTQMTPDMFAKRMQQSLQPQQTQQTQQMPTTRGVPTTSVWDAETANMRAGLIQFAKDSGPITSMVELANAHNMQVFSAKTGASRAMA